MFMERVRPQNDVEGTIIPLYRSWNHEWQGWTSSVNYSKYSRTLPSSSANQHLPKSPRTGDAYWTLPSIKTTPTERGGGLITNESHLRRSLGNGLPAIWKAKGRSWDDNQISLSSLNNFPDQQLARLSARPCRKSHILEMDKSNLHPHSRNSSRFCKSGSIAILVVSSWQLPSNTAERWGQLPNRRIADEEPFHGIPLRWDYIARRWSTNSFAPATDIKSSRYVFFVRREDKIWHNKLTPAAVYIISLTLTAMTNMMRRTSWRESGLSSSRSSAYLTSASPATVGAYSDRSGMNNQHNGYGPPQASARFKPRSRFCLFVSVGASNKLA